MEKREIKFRAFDVSENMTYFTLDPKTMLKGVPEPLRGMIKQEEGYHLMQYTGLKDKNGKEIYEGDLVKIVSINEIREVIYHKCSFGVAIDEALFAPVYWHGDVEVLGNIYEHPSLLTEIKR